VNATHLKRRNHATAVGKLATSRATALTLVLAVEELQVARADTLVAGVAKSATNAARLDTLLVTAPKDRMEEDTAVRAKAVTVVVDTEAVVGKARPATRVEDTVTCLVTAHKVKNATTVRTP